MPEISVSEVYSLLAVQSADPVVWLTFTPDTLCVHGDSTVSIAALKPTRKELERA